MSSQQAGEADAGSKAEGAIILETALELDLTLVGPGFSLLFKK